MNWILPSETKKQGEVPRQRSQQDAGGHGQRDPFQLICHNICVLIQEMHELGIEVEFSGTLE
jgi:hypothetical protein